MNPLLAALESAQTGVDPRSAIVLLWLVIGVMLLALLWPRGRGRRLARQILAVAVLSFREGVRLKVLWTVFALALVIGFLAYYSDADGTHVGRASLVLSYCLSTGEILGASLIVLLSALSVAREIESRIMHTLGTKPIPRWGILIGKALGFWVIDLLFLAGLTLFAAALVRAVPARPESREVSRLASSGSWADLRRNVLTTRQHQLADDNPGSSAAYKTIAPGRSREWVFTLDPELNRSEALAVRFQFSSSLTFAPAIEQMGISVAGDAAAAPLIKVVERVPQDRPFDLFITPEQLAGSGKLQVLVSASDQGRIPLTLVGTVRLGVPVDDFESNLLKAFLLMALQGWVLAMITASWSGVLSFPVTVALGVILVLGGEMSRHALVLLQSSASRMQALGLPSSASGFQQAMTAQLRVLLELLPDFRVLGGPAAFVEGECVSGWALAHAVLMMGIVRVIGWSLPGVFLFHRREVGK